MQPTNGPHPMDYYYFTLGQGRQDARIAVAKLTKDNFASKSAEQLATEIADNIYNPSGELPNFDFEHIEIRIPVLSGNPDILENTGLLSPNDWKLENGAITLNADGEDGQLAQVRRELTAAIQTGKQQGSEVKQRMIEDILPMVQERKKELTSS